MSTSSASPQRILLFFLHDAGSSGSDISSFFSSIPLESFGDKSFTEVTDMLSIQLVTPTAKIQSNFFPKEEEEGLEGFTCPPDWEWYAVSPDWKVLGMENSQEEDKQSIALSKKQLHEELLRWEERCDYIFVGGFAHGGNMCLQLLNENDTGPFAMPTSSGGRYLNSLQRRHPKILGLFTISSFLPSSSETLSLAYNASVTNESKGNDSNPGREKKTLPVLMMHGEEDETVPCDWGRATASQLVLHESVDVRFQTFVDTEHEIGEDQLHVLLDWVEATVNANKSLSDGIIFQYDGETEAVIDKEPNRQYLIEAIAGAQSNLYRITYPAEPDVVHALTGRPVLACGGMFEITEAPNGVQCIINSPNPEKTAVAIGERLVARIASHRDGSGNAGEDVCTIS